MSAILVQNDDAGNDRVVWYASRALRTGERKWSAIERECAAVIFGVDTFHQFLLGARFTLITDHQALVSLKKMSNTNAKLMRWVVKLQGYSFDIVHRPGRLHVDADYLSKPVEQQTPLLLESIKAELNKGLLSFRSTSTLRLQRQLRHKVTSQLLSQESLHHPPMHRLRLLSAYARHLMLVAS
jgi:hypothetical protein